MNDTTVVRLKALYGALDEESRLSRDNVGKLEYLTITAILDEYLRSPCRVLDVAAGCGKYALLYATQGHALWAQDIVDEHVTRMRKVAAEQGLNLNIDLGDASDLSRFEDGFFDMVLCMGPIYHMANDRKRSECLKENIRVLRPDGILAVSYLNTPMSQDSRFQGELGGVAIDSCFYPSSPDETERLLRDLNLSIIDHLAADGIARQISEAVNEFSETEFGDWMRFHMKICRSPIAFKYNWNGLIICRKMDASKA